MQQILFSASAHKLWLLGVGGWGGDQSRLKVEQSGCTLGQYPSDELIDVAVNEDR